jgi:hypothetical protein
MLFCSLLDFGMGLSLQQCALLMGYNFHHFGCLGLAALVLARPHLLVADLELAHYLLLLLGLMHTLDSFLRLALILLPLVI